MAIALIAASQHHRCPAMRVCAWRSPSELVDPVIDAANAFADALQDAEQRLPPEAVAGARRGVTSGGKTFTPRGRERGMEETTSFRLQRRLARLWESGNLGWSLGALFVSLIAIAPLIAIATLAAQSSGDTWPHLIANVLPGALKTTLLLMLGVGTLTLVIGTGTAWLVTMYRFPGSRILAWLLLLPLAMPTYIIAFCFLELFDYSGLLQTSLRTMFG
jgi:hypothetical protein